MKYHLDVQPGWDKIKAGTNAKDNIFARLRHITPDGRGENNQAQFIMMVIPPPDELPNLGLTTLL